MATSIETNVSLKINRIPSKTVLDDMVQNNQLQPNQLYMIPSEIGDGLIALQTKKVWENSSLASSFSATTVQIDLSDYDYLLIRYGFYASQETSRKSALIKVGETATLDIYAPTMNEAGTMYFFHRLVETSQSSIIFGNAVIGYGTVSVSNSGCIPHEIIAIKLINSHAEITNIYSKTETIVGRWVDNKPIYRKIIEFNNTTVGSSSGSLAHNISNIDNVINCTAMMKSTNSNDSYYGYTWLPNNVCGIKRADTSNIYFYNGGDSFSGQTYRTWYFTLEYTKTTD